MGQGTVYPFVVKNIRSNMRGRAAVLETGCGAAKYRPFISTMGAYYCGCDVPNDHYQDWSDVDVYASSDALPFRENTFDLIFNQGAIDYMPNWPETFSEAYRVLKKKGLFLIYTYNVTTLQEIHSNCLISNRSWERSHRVFSEHQILEAFRKAGFRAKDVSMTLETWTPEGVFNRIRSSVTGELGRKRLNSSIWRAYRGQKR